MPIKTFGSEVLFPADLNNGPFSDALQADVVTAQNTSSTSYTDLATVGPSVTMTLVSGQGCLVIISARGCNSLGGTGGQSVFSFAVSGATTLSASDSNGLEALAPCTGGPQSTTSTRVTWFTAAATGSHTFTMKYKVANGGTSTFADRRIIVKKF